MALAVNNQQEWRVCDEIDESGGGYVILPPIDIPPKENCRRKEIEDRFHGGDETKAEVNLASLIVGVENSSVSTRTIKDGSRSRFGEIVEDNKYWCSWLSNKKILRERQRTRTPGNEAEEQYPFGDPLVIPSRGVLLKMECKLCWKKGDHWSFECPCIALRTETSVDGSSTEPPICQVCKRPADVIKRGIDEASVRLINLPKETCESDLVDLVCRFGPLTRVSLSVDENADSTRKVAVVVYERIKDAEKAIRLLNGYDYYNNAILRVEWATPRQVPAYPSFCPSCLEESETCIRVSNISEKFTGCDFLNLFDRSGLLSVAYLDADKMTGSQTKFGIVEYFRRVDAERAIRLLNGFDIFDLKIQVQGPLRLQDLRRDLGA